MNNHAYHLRVFFHQVVFFVVIVILSLLVGYLIIFEKTESAKALGDILVTEKIQVWQFILIFFIATIFIVFVLRFFRGKAFFDFVFTFIFAYGIFFIFMVPLTPMPAAIVSVLLIILNALYYKVWTHNLVITFGIAGVALNLGLRLSVFTVLIILLILSVYDYIAVYKTKHMVRIFRALKERGVVLSLVVPSQVKGFATKLSNIQEGNNYMFIGTGDLAFPAIFAVSALYEDITIAFYIAIGGLVGIILTQLIFMMQKERKPIPALPTISFCCVLGYLISIF